MIEYEAEVFFGQNGSYLVIRELFGSYDDIETFLKATYPAATSFNINWVEP